MAVYLTQIEAARLRRTIRRYVDAAIDNDNKGSGPPEDALQIEADLRNAEAEFWSQFVIGGNAPAPTPADGGIGNLLRRDQK